MKQLKFIFIFLTLIIIGCNYPIPISSENFPEQEKLKIAIAKSIVIPFEVSDTLIHDSFLGLCGNTPEEELNKYYTPRLEKSPYFEILKNNFEGTIYDIKGEEFLHLRDSLCKNKKESLADCFHKNKIIFSITGYAKSNHSVKIHERYYSEKKAHSIDKFFEYTNGNWHFHVTNDELKNK